MPPNSKPRGRGSLRSRFGQLNPAFAAAHGIGNNTPVAEGGGAEAEPEVVDREAEKKLPPELRSDSVVLPVSPSPIPQSATNKPAAGLQQIKVAVGRARTSGKLQVSDAGLETPLPKILFEFPSLADTVDLSLDTNPNQLKPWESHVAETLVLVDFSDNEGITEFPIFPLDQDRQNHFSDNSVERYRSVQIFRARRCRLHKFIVAPTLPESWPQLLTLDLSGNRLAGEFPLLYLPKTIRELDLSGNRLASLKCSQDPSTSIDLPQLISLDISMNQITSTGISPVLHVPCLQRINVGHNQIFNLNFILKAISSSEKSLTTLHASKSLLSDLDGRQPIDLTSFCTLLSVDLSENSLCRVPQIPAALQRLNVNGNQIASIRGLLSKDDDDGDDDTNAAVSSCSLVVLQIQRNKLKELDSEVVAKLTQLNRLDLQFNNLSGLPLELGDLVNLQQMFLEGNHLNSLRSSGIRGDLNDTKSILMRLRNRTKLDSVDADTESCTESSPDSGKSKDTIGNGNNVNTTVFKAKKESLLSSLLVGTKVLNYEGKHAHMLPYKLLEEIRGASPDIVQKIERFNVAKNHLQTIESDWFALLPQLAILEAHGNRLDTLPGNIRELAFSQIHLARNCLTSHAVQFSVLLTSPKSNIITDTLEVLDLAGNHMTTFPPELMRHFKSLRHLNLSGNRILSLKNIVDAPYPPCCPTLEHLNLSENRIADLGGDDLPIMLKVGCPNLQSLRLENNEMEIIPMTLGLLENLNFLDLRGNPQRMIRFEVLDKSTSEMLQYMQNRITSKSRERAQLRMEELRRASENNSEPSLLQPTLGSATIPYIPPAIVDVEVSPPSPPCKTNRMIQTKMSDYASPAKKEVKTPLALGHKESMRSKGTRSNTTSIPKSIMAVSKVSTPRKSLSTPSKPPAVTATRKPPSTPTKSPSTPRKASPPVGSPRSSRMLSPRTRQGLSPSPLGGNSQMGKGNAPKDTSSTILTSPLLEELEKSIEELSTEMDKPGLSEPKRYAIKKKLAMERSKRLREERRIKERLGHSGIY